MTDAPEPERYHEWILWKFKKERAFNMEQQIDLFNNGKEVMTMEDLLKKDIAEMQKQVNTLQVRVKELIEENNKLKENANISK